MQLKPLTLGTGHYLSPWGGKDFFGGVYLILGGQKGGSLKTLEGFRAGTTQICLENEDSGGARKSSNVIRRDHFSEVTNREREPTQDRREQTQDRIVAVVIAI